LQTPITVQAPARVLAEPVFDAHLAPGTPIVVTGFGVHDLATQAAGQLYIAETPYVRRVPTEFFAGGVNTPDSCNGDSGGPAYVMIGGEAVLVGATSRATSIATAPCGQGGVYTTIGAYDDWLRNASGGAYQGAVDPSPGAPQQGPGNGAGEPKPAFGSGTGHADDDDDDGGGSRSACSMSPGSNSASPWWLLLLSLLLWRRGRVCCELGPCGARSPGRPPCG
jgi:hypothetical protein